MGDGITNWSRTDKRKECLPGILFLVLVLVMVPAVGESTYMCYTDIHCDLGLCLDDWNSCVSPFVARNETTLDLYWEDTSEVGVLTFNRGARAKSIDVVFVTDFTASMADDLEQFITDWDSIVYNMGSKVQNKLRVAMIPFQDELVRKLPGPTGDPIDVLTTFKDFETDTDANIQYFKDRLQVLKDRAETVGGGGDCRENSYDAIRYAIEEDWDRDYEFGALPGECDNGACAWRPDALKIIFVTTDAAVFTGRYNEMELLGNAANAAGVVVFGLTPNPSEGEAKSPCPPTCPLCTSTGNDCGLTCTGEGAARLCESTCCSGDPSWKGNTGDTCDDSIPDPMDCSGMAWAPDTEREAYRYCYDLINITKDTKGKYFDGFSLGSLSQKINAALDSIDYNIITLSLAGPNEVHTGILNTITGRPEPSTTVMLQAYTGEQCTEMIEGVPCNALRRVEVTVPEGTPVGWYNYTLTIKSDTGDSETLDLDVAVKAPVNVEVDYAPYVLDDRLLAFVNITNKSPIAAAVPDRERAEVSCDSVKAGLLWEAGVDTIPPGDSMTVVADCLGAARSSNGYQLIIEELSPQAIADRDPERINVTFLLLDSKGDPVPFMENAYLYSITFNGKDMGEKGVVYDVVKGRYKLTVDVPAGTAKDGFNVLKVAVEDAGKTASDARFVRWGNDRLELSSFIPFGDDPRQQVDKASSRKLKDVRRPSLDIGLRSLFLHQTFIRGDIVKRAGPQLIVNYTTERGFMLFQGFDRSTGIMDVVVNKTGLLPGTVIRTYEREFVEDHAFYIAIREGDEIGGSRLIPAQMVTYGILDRAEVGIQRPEERWRGDTYVVGHHYNNLSLHHPEDVTFIFSVPVNVTTVALNVSSPAFSDTRQILLDKHGHSEEGLYVNRTEDLAHGSLVTVHVRAKDAGIIWVNLTTGHQDLFFIKVPFRITEPFRISAPENMTVVPNKTGEFALRLHNLKFEQDIYRVCGTTTGVKAWVSGIEVTGQPDKQGKAPCHSVTVDGGATVTLNTTVRLETETGGDLILNVTSESDERLSRIAKVSLLPSFFTSSHIQLKECVKNEWDLSCNFEFINGGNVRNTYRYGFAGDILLVTPPFSSVDVDAKASSNKYLKARIIGCSLDLDLKSYITSVGKLFFLAKLFADGGNFTTEGPLASFFTEADVLATRADDMGVPTESASLKGAIEAFRASPDAATGTALAEAVEALYTAFFEVNRKTCRLSRATSIEVTAYACDTPMQLDDELRYACVNRTFEVTDILIDLDYELKPDPALTSTLQKTGALHVLAGQEASFDMVIRNNLHFPLLFDFIASEGYSESALAEESEVLIEEDSEHVFTVPISWSTPDRYMVHAKALPTGYTEQQRKVPVPVEVDIEEVLDMELEVHVSEVALSAGEKADLVATLTNKGNGKATFIVSVDGDTDVFSQPGVSRPLLDAGASVNITLTATAPEERGVQTATLSVTHGIKDDLVRTVKFSVTVSAPEFSLTVPETLGENSTVRIENLGDADGTIALTLNDESAACIILSNTSVEVPAGGFVEIGITSECTELESFELLVEGANYDKVHPIAVEPPTTSVEPTMEATPEATPEPTPDPESGGMGAGAVIAIIVFIGAGAVIAQKKGLIGGGTKTPAKGMTPMTSAAGGPGMTGTGGYRGAQQGWPKQGSMYGNRTQYPPRR